MGCPSVETEAAEGCRLVLTVKLTVLPISHFGNTSRLTIGAHRCGSSCNYAEQSYGILIQRLRALGPRRWSWETPPGAVSCL